MKRFAFATLAVATALAITPISLMADTISINFTPDGSKSATTVTAYKNGEITFNTMANLEVLFAADSEGNPPVSLAITNADVTITADYNGGTYSGVETVSVTSTSCGGTCLTGTFNTGDYSSTAKGTGDFSGSFTVDSVSSILDADFGAFGFLANSGVDTFNTGSNKVTIGTNTLADTSVLTGGVITYDTPAPEPSSLILLGTGLFGLAFVAFRKAKSSGLVLHS